MKSDIILEARGLTKQFAGFSAVSGWTSKCAAGRSMR